MIEQKTKDVIELMKDEKDNKNEMDSDKEEESDDEVKSD